MRGFIAVLVLCFITSVAFAQAAPLVINEFVNNHTGTDTHEFIEVFGPPGTDLSRYWVIGIEGDNTGAGTLDNVFQLTSTDAAGFWTTGFLGNTLENGTLTFLLVMDLVGTQGQDLDMDDDGVIDYTAFSAVLDGVAVWDGGVSDIVYTDVVLDPWYDGLGFTVGGASRIPNGLDTDTVGDWVRNDFDGFGLPGFVGTPILGEALNTPGAVNALAIPEPATLLLASLGALALWLRRRS